MVGNITGQPGTESGDIDTREHPAGFVPEYGIKGGMAGAGTDSGAEDGVTGGPAEAASEATLNPHETREGAGDALGTDTDREVALDIEEARRDEQ